MERIIEQQHRQKHPLRSLAVTGAVAFAVGTVITLLAVTSRGPIAAAQGAGAEIGASPTPGPGSSSSSTSEPAPTLSSSTIESPTDTAATTPVPEEVAATTPANPATTPEPSAEPETPTPSIESLITGRQLYATGTVNVRDARGTDGTTVVDGLAAGQVVTGGDTVDGWVPVHAGDTYGWVSADYLADGAPPVAVPPQPAADPGAGVDAAELEAALGNWMEQLIPHVDPGGEANWVFARNHAWGASDGHTNYIDPDVPADKRFSVMVHEFSHVKQVEVYGSLSNSIAALSAINGGSSSDNSANESTADCMALMLGATWVDYGCQDSLRGAATAILAGQRP